MELLTETTDINELMRIRMLFESNGIAIFISNEDSARNFGFIYPARKYGIFVVYENQWEDAKALLFDENYSVQNPMDLESHRDFIESHKPDVEKKLFNLVMNITIITFCIIGAIVFFTTINKA